MIGPRRSVQDFIAQINGQTNSINTYVGSLNPDGTVKVTRNGYVLYSRIFWGNHSVAVTDMNTTGDGITFLGELPPGRTGDTAIFLLGLT